jgi:hypothetical protein
MIRAEPGEAAHPDAGATASDEQRGLPMDGNAAVSDRRVAAAQPLREAA